MGLYALSSEYGPIATPDAVRYKVRAVGAKEMAVQSSEYGVEFTLSDPPADMPRGVLVGLKSMKRGEQAMLTIKPEYGYGDAGLPPNVPPGAKLEAEVELLACKMFEEVTEDGLVSRKVMVESPNKSDYSKPNDQVGVSVALSLGPSFVCRISVH